MDILSYPYEFFVLRDFIIHSISFVDVYLLSMLGYGLLKVCSMK